MTAIEFAVQPVRELYAGALFFPVEQTADVLHTWTELLPTPARRDHVVGERHALPAAAGGARGGPRALVRDRHGGVPGLRGRGRELLRAAARLGPEMDTFAMQAPVALGELAMDPRDPLPYRSAHALVDELPAAAIDELARIAGPGSALTLRAAAPHGRRARPPRAGRGSARDAARRDLRVRPRRRPDAAAEPAVAAELDALAAAVAPHRVGDYPNFVEEPADASALLRRRDLGSACGGSKALYDPAGPLPGQPPHPARGPGLRPHPTHPRGSRKEPS